MYRILIILLILVINKVFALNPFPYIQEEVETFSEGKIKKFYYNDSSETYYYYVIPNWAGKKEFIFFWKNDNTDTKIGKNLNQNFIHEIFKYGDKLLIIASNDDIFSLIIADKELNIEDKYLISDNIEINHPKIKTMIINNEVFIIKLNNYLYKFARGEINLIDNEVTNICLNNHKLIIESGLFGISNLKTYNLENDKVVNLTIYDTYENSKIICKENTLFFFGSNNSTSSYCFSINLISYNKSESIWLDAPINLIDVRYENNKSVFYLIKKIDSEYHLFSEQSENSINNSVNFKLYYIEPQKLEIIGNHIYIIFRNAFIIKNFDFESMLLVNTPIGEKYNETPEIFINKNEIILSSTTYSEIIKTKKNNFWQIKKYFNLIYDYFFPIIFILLILIFIQLYRHQKRYVSEILENPSLGIVLIINRQGNLIRRNQKASEIFNIPYNAPGKRAYEYYFNLSEYNPFYEMINRSFKTRLDHQKKIKINYKGNSKEWVCRTNILKNITGQFRGLIFTALDITEQLERKRLSNWAQLAHDMQTNLSTIKLNAQQIETNENENNTQRKNKIIHQVNVLFSRVRDIITVGKSSELKIEKVNAAEICKSARMEFDELMFPEVNFELETQEIILKCDKSKLIRAIRNTIENGIKALKNKKGTIKIKCYKDEKYAIFSIKDTGIGMDENIKNKMLNPYFTTGENTGGSGIGTMIMQHVVELHNGKLEIKSKKGEGTEIIFKIPIN